MVIKRHRQATQPGAQGREPAGRVGFGPGLRGGSGEDNDPLAFGVQRTPTPVCAVRTRNPGTPLRSAGVAPSRRQRGREPAAGTGCPPQPTPVAARQGKTIGHRSGRWIELKRCGRGAGGSPQGRGDRSSREDKFAERPLSLQRTDRANRQQRHRLAQGQPAGSDLETATCSRHAGQEARRRYMIDTSRGRRQAHARFRAGAVSTWRPPSSPVKGHRPPRGPAGRRVPCRGRESAATRAPAPLAARPCALSERLRPGVPPRAVGRPGCQEGCTSAGPGPATTSGDPAGSTLPPGLRRAVRPRGALGGHTPGRFSPGGRPRPPSAGPPWLPGVCPLVPSAPAGGAPAACGGAFSRRAGQRRLRGGPASRGPTRRFVGGPGSRRQGALGVSPGPTTRW